MLPATESRRCQLHDLAAGPDGLCVVCRRVAAERLKDRFEVSMGGGSALTWLLGVATIASIGGLAFATHVPGLGFGGTFGQAEQPSLPRSIAPSRGLATTPKPRPTDKPMNVGAKPLGKPLGSDEADEERKTEPTDPALQAQLDEQARRRQAEQDARDRNRHAAVQSQLDEQALAAARRNVSIEMYSTSWCGVCTTARSYMREHDIAFVDHDIDEDADAKARAHALNPRNSVPVIDVGGDVMIGFSASGLEAKLDQAARKRVGL